MRNQLGGDVFDSRDVEARIVELEETRDAFIQDWVEANRGESATDVDEDVEDDRLRRMGLTRWEDANDADADELRVLYDLRDEVRSSEWPHGIQFINDNYFEEWCQEFAEDIGAIPRDLGWPCCHIDWTAAADALKVDYTSVEVYDGTYWYRNC